MEGWHRRRLELMPGMTGPWQILGPARVPLREMVAIDYLYVANWTLWSDVRSCCAPFPTSSAGAVSTGAAGRRRGRRSQRVEPSAGQSSYRLRAARRC